MRAFGPKAKHSSTRRRQALAVFWEDEPGHHGADAAWRPQVPLGIGGNGYLAGYPHRGVRDGWRPRGRMVTPSFSGGVSMEND